MTTLARAAPAVWPRQALSLALAATGILALYAADVADVIRLWATSDTFGHCALVPPLVGWLIWRRRGDLAQLDPHGWAPGLLLAAMGAAAWLFGSATDIAQSRHLALPLMLQGATLALLGPAVGRVLAFPLAWMVFAIPFGIELVPPLQAVTADLAMALLSVSGVEAARDGIFITTPAGLFRVAEACAGVNFLIAMVAFATLAAHVLFASPWRQLAFVAFAAAASILANGVRAWGTILVAQFHGTAVAVAVDHIVYGWVFFAVVLAGVVAIGLRFAQPVSPSRAGPSGVPSDNALVSTVLATLVTAPPMLAALAATP